MAPLFVLADVGAVAESSAGLFNEVFAKMKVGLSLGPSIDADRGRIEKWLVWAGGG